MDTEKTDRETPHSLYCVFVVSFSLFVILVISLEYALMIVDLAEGQSTS